MGNYKTEERRDSMVYLHRRNDDNSVFYVGIGVDDYRPKSKKNRNRYWHNIVKKVGYTIEVVHKGLTWDEAVEYEKKYIKEFGRKDLGLGRLVNQTDGGEGQKNPSKKTRELIRLANTGEKNPNYGKPKSDEWKNHMRQIQQGEKSQFAVLKKEQVLEIRRLYTSGVRLYELVKMYEGIITRGGLEGIVKRKSWSHLPLIEGEITSQSTNEGCKNHRAKLSREDVLFIRENYIPRHKEFGRLALAEKFGVFKTTIGAVVRGISYKNVV